MLRVTILLMLRVMHRCGCNPPKGSVIKTFLVPITKEKNKLNVGPRNMTKYLAGKYASNDASFILTILKA